MATGEEVLRLAATRADETAAAAAAERFGEDGDDEDIVGEEAEPRR